MTPNIEKTPDIKLSVNQTFGIESDMEVDAFSERTEYVPEIDKTYKFDKETTFEIGLKVFDIIWPSFLRSLTYS